MAPTLLACFLNPLIEVSSFLEPLLLRTVITSFTQRKKRKKRDRKKMEDRQYSSV